MPTIFCLAKSCMIVLLLFIASLESFSVAECVPGAAAGCQSWARAGSDMGPFTGHQQPTSTARRLQADLQPSENITSSIMHDDSHTVTCWGWVPSCMVVKVDRPIFALMGDSITAFGFNSDGFAIKMSQTYQGSVSILNYGVEGATTRRVDEVTDKVLQQLQPYLQQVQLAAVWFGANDAVLPHAPNWHLPLPTYKDNLMRMVKRLQDAGIRRIVLLTPPPVGPHRRDRKNNHTQGYADTVLQLAQELQLEHIDMYSQLMAEEDWEKTNLHSDNLHLSPAGQDVVYNALMQLLSSSADTTPARMLAVQKQIDEGQRDRCSTSAQPSFHSSSGSTFKYLLCAAVLLTFLAVCREAKLKALQPLKSSV